MIEKSEGVGRSNRESYEVLFGGIPDALYVLGGDVERDGGRLGFRSPNYFSNNVDGIGGGRYRMLAASDVARTVRDIPIFTSGGSAYPGTIPTTAEVVAHELVLRGIHQERITRFPDTMTTSMEMVRILELCSNIGATFPHERDFGPRIIVITNEHHVVRAERIFWLLAQGNVDILPKHLYENYESFPDIFQQTLADYARSQAQVLFSSCESILAIKDSSFADFFEGVKATPEYAKREKLEEQGLLDINGKVYKSRV